MGFIHSLLFFIAVNVLSTCGNMPEIRNCITPRPEYHDGWCVPVSQCKIIQEVKNKISTIPKPYQEFIRNSKCADRPEEKYCCTLKHIDSAFIKINKLENLSNSSNNNNCSRISNEPISNTEPTIPNIMSYSDTGDIDSHENFKLLPAECGEISENDRISFGNLTGLKEFPFMALLQFDRAKPYFGCGGTLINEKYVLTAAHCVLSNLFSIRLGEHTIDETNDCEPYDEEYDELICNDPVQDIPIEMKIIHQKFDKFRGTNDIALLRLVRPVNLKVNNVKTICLPTKLTNISLSSGIIAGWGTTEKGTSSNALLKGNVFVNKEREKCINTYHKIYSVNVTDTFLCATGANNVDTCEGDSGGPLFQQFQLENGEAKKYVQFGVVSAGPRIKCGDSNQVGGSLYTNIPKYIKWILNNLRP